MMEQKLHLGFITLFSPEEAEAFEEYLHENNVFPVSVTTTEEGEVAFTFDSKDELERALELLKTFEYYESRLGRRVRILKEQIKQAVVIYAPTEDEKDRARKVLDLAGIIEPEEEYDVGRQLVFVFRDERAVDDAIRALTQAGFSERTIREQRKRKRKNPENRNNKSMVRHQGIPAECPGCGTTFSYIVQWKGPSHKTTEYERKKGNICDLCGFPLIKVKTESKSDFYICKLCSLLFEVTKFAHTAKPGGTYSTAETPSQTIGSLKQVTPLDIQRLNEVIEDPKEVIGAVTFIPNYGHGVIKDADEERYVIEITEPAKGAEVEKGDVIEFIRSTKEIVKLSKRERIEVTDTETEEVPIKDKISRLSTIVLRCDEDPEVDKVLEIAVKEPIGVVDVDWDDREITIGGREELVNQFLKKLKDKGLLEKIRTFLKAETREIQVDAGAPDPIGDAKEAVKHYIASYLKKPIANRRREERTILKARKVEKTILRAKKTENGIILNAKEKVENRKEESFLPYQAGARISEEQLMCRKCGYVTTIAEQKANGYTKMEELYKCPKCGGLLTKGGKKLGEAISLNPEGVTEMDIQAVNELASAMGIAPLTLKQLQTLLAMAVQHEDVYKVAKLMNVPSNLVFAILGWTQDTGAGRLNR